ncbi:nucleolar protein 10-like [Planoprotostelium fungivorum]|uniref:Nucleolar protein 10-like n=1 Tax=Planoprotostelium fungivorum TaxID=1890364 RepID=A0A2P6N6M8_9EUKA|nr:nucleolar protein 10-like [Planoprotostelium fungivorum]
MSGSGTGLSALPDLGGFKVYNVGVGKSLEEWIQEKKSKRALRYDEDFRRRIELLQDFNFPASSQAIRLSKDGQYVISCGMYPPQIKIHDTQQLSVKAQRNIEAEAITFEILSDDFRKLVILKCDRSVEFHAGGGVYSQVRVPRVGRTLLYDQYSCDVIVGGASNQAYRFNLETGTMMEPWNTTLPGINSIDMSAEHQLLIFGGEKGLTEYWDPRAKKPISTKFISVDLASGDEGEEVSKVKFDPFNILQFGIGTSGGNILLYDLRKNTPIAIKDHRNDIPIRGIHFASKSHLLTQDARIVKIWDVSDHGAGGELGKMVSSIEPSHSINDMVVAKDSGLVLMAMDHPRMNAYFIPALGQAPKWCSFLDSMTEELEEDANTPNQDMKFVTEDEIKKLGLAQLIGTKYLKQFMHGYWIDMKLYSKFRAIVSPYDYEKAKKERIAQKIDEERENRVKTKTAAPKVNAKVAARLMADAEEGPEKAKKTAQSILNDTRFSKIFSDPNFTVDEMDPRYRVMKVDPRRTIDINEHFLPVKMTEEDEDDEEEEEEETPQKEVNFYELKEGHDKFIEGDVEDDTNMTLEERLKKMKTKDRSRAVIETSNGTRSISFDLKPKVDKTKESRYKEQMKEHRQRRGERRGIRELRLPDIGSGPGGVVIAGWVPRHVLNSTNRSSEYSCQKNCKAKSPPVGVEPTTFRFEAERASIAPGRPVMKLTQLLLFITPEKLLSRADSFGKELQNIYTVSPLRTRKAICSYRRSTTRVAPAVAIEGTRLIVAKEADFVFGFFTKEKSKRSPGEHRFRRHTFRGRITENIINDNKADVQKLFGYLSSLNNANKDIQAVEKLAAHIESNADEHIYTSTLNSNWQAEEICRMLQQGETNLDNYNVRSCCAALLLLAENFSGFISTDLAQRINNCDKKRIKEKHIESSVRPHAWDFWFTILNHFQRLAERNLVPVTRCCLVLSRAVKAAKEKIQSSKKQLSPEEARKKQYHDALSQYVKKQTDGGSNEDSIWEWENILVVEDLFLVKSLLSRAAYEELPLLVDGLVYCFDAKGISMALIEDMLVCEIDLHSDPLDLFKNETRCTHMLAAFSKLYANPFVTSCLSSSVEHIIASYKKFQSDEDRASDEMAPLKSAKTVTRDQLMEATAQSIFDQMSANSSLFPEPMRHLCSLIRSCVEKKFPGGSFHSLTHFAIRRMLAPVIRNPASCPGLLKAPIAQRQQNALKNVAKALEDYSDKLLATIEPDLGATLGMSLSARSALSNDQRPARLLINFLKSITTPTRSYISIVDVNMRLAALENTLKVFRRKVVHVVKDFETPEEKIPLEEDKRRPASMTVSPSLLYAAPHSPSLTPFLRSHHDLKKMSLPEASFSFEENLTGGL